MDRTTNASATEDQLRAEEIHTRASNAADAAARRLGWFSIALGVAELLMPRTVAQATGLQRRDPLLLQLYGLREIGTGVALLTADDPRPWLWARVVGDVIDAATLSTELDSGNDDRSHTIASLAAVAGLTLMDMSALRQAGQQAWQAKSEGFDYSDRVGMPLSPDEMRGKARSETMPAASATG